MFSDLGISWSTPLLILAIFGVIRYFARKFSKNEDKINWSALESVSVTLAIYFAGQVLAVLIIYSILKLLGQDEKQMSDWISNNIQGQFWFVLLVESITFSLIYWFLKKRQSSLAAIGLNRKPRFKDLGLAIVGFMVYFGILLIATTVFEKLLPNVNKDQNQIIGFDGASGGQLILVFISLVVLPPIIEEILARGFLFSGLKKAWPIWWAALATSGLFALAHLQAGSGEPLLWTAALDTFILSMVLIYLKQKTGSLWSSIMLHMLKNGLAFFVLFVFHLS